MENKWRINGKVRNVSKGLTKTITIYSPEDKKTYICCNTYPNVPIKQNDAISVLCSKSTENITKFIERPIVKLSTDKDTIIGCLFGALYDRPKWKILTIMSEFNTKKPYNMTLDEYLCQLSINWNTLRSEDAFVTFSGICPKDCIKICEYWYTNRVLRRIRLLGLTYSDIFEIHLPIGKMYDLILSNPYLIPEIPIEKADEIRSQRLIPCTMEDRDRGLCLRKIYEFQKKGWMGIPIQLMERICSLYTFYSKSLQEKGMCVVNCDTVYLKSYYEIETYLAKYLEKLNDMKPIKLMGEIETFYHENLTDEQKICVRKSLELNITLITGGAGTGKTYVISEITKQLEKHYIPYLVTSFTGKAVARIRECLNNPSMIIATIHWCIMNFTKIPQFKVLIFDESSMITNELFYKFIQCFIHDFKIILIGDNNQLEPIGGGSLFSSCFTSNVFPTFTLTKIHRTTRGSTIEANSLKIVEYMTKTCLPAFEFYKSDTFQLCDGNLDTIKSLVQEMYHNKIPVSDFTILTFYNEDVDRLNSILSQIYCPNRTEILGNFCLGDKVVLIKNKYEIGLMNGEEGYVTSITYDAVGVTFRNSQEYVFKIQSNERRAKQDFTQDFTQDSEQDITKELTVSCLKLSYSITIHRAQGSEWPYVILYFPQRKNEVEPSDVPPGNPPSDVPPGNPPSDVPPGNPKIIYTAITRAKKTFWCIGDILNFTIMATKQRASYRPDNLSKRLSHHDEQIELIDM